MQFLYRSIRVDQVDGESRLSVGCNLVQGVRATAKENEALGRVAGRENRLTHSAAWVFDMDQVDGPTLRRPGWGVGGIGNGGKGAGQQ
ncbi:MAG: hypothetical protein K6T78_06255 [Alicyclobacillus sp.]|nr:hypothetical protein [Alicyclobacillus sp.]